MAELPMSATLSSIVLSSTNFGLAFQLHSVKFQQYQTVLRSSLKSSKDEAIVRVWKNTNCRANIQYNIYKNTKQVLKSIRTEHTKRLQTELPLQGFIISFLLAHSLKSLNSLWSRAQSRLPTNIFNFTIRYLNITLATRKNLYLWGLSNSSSCSFCLQPESLLHIVAGCKTYLDQGRFTWQHNSALHFLAQTFQSVDSSKLYVDLPGYLSPCIITGDSLQPDMLLSTIGNRLYIIELTVGFETNLANNAHQKELKCHSLVTDLTNTYHSEEFINLSMSFLGIFGQTSASFLKMGTELVFDNQHFNFTISKLSAIAIRTTYYLFCMRNKPWCSPELLSY